LQLGISKSLQFDGLIHWMAINRIAGLNAHAGACGTDRIEVMRRHDCVASLRFGEKMVETPAGSCKYSGRPARSNVIIAPSSTRRSAGYAEMLMNTTEKLSRRLFPCVRNVGASVVKIFCRYIYGVSLLFKVGLKRHEVLAARLPILRLSILLTRYDSADN